MSITQSDARAGTATSAATARTPAGCQKGGGVLKKAKKLSQTFSIRIHKKIFLRLFLAIHKDLDIPRPCKFEAKNFMGKG